MLKQIYNTTNLSILYPEDNKASRFGSSVACLGRPDASILDTLVVVGAPYYEATGAVFVYRVELATNLCEVFTITEKAPTFVHIHKDSRCFY